jgi:hypothetical protein
MNGSRHSPEDSFPCKLDGITKVVVFASGIFLPPYRPSSPFSFGTVRLQRITLPLQKTIALL